MASRKEQKEALRAERERKAREAEAAERRRRLIGFGAAGVLALAAIGAIVAVLVLGGDDDKQPGGGGGANVALPEKKTDDLKAAAEAAGCTYKEFPDEGNSHLGSPTATFDEYKTNPPTSGTHRPPPAAPDGVYEPGNSPDKEDWVHTLEHGRVIFMYKPGTDKRRRDQLETLMNEPVGDEPSAFKTVLMENNTKMPFDVAAVSWTRYLGCEEFNDRVFDALRAFREKSIQDNVAPEGDFPWPANE